MQGPRNVTLKLIAGFAMSTISRYLENAIFNGEIQKLALFREKKSREQKKKNVRWGGSAT